MIWIGVGVFAFLLVAGVRLMTQPRERPETPTAPQPEPEPEAGLELASRLRRLAARVVDAFAVIGIIFAAVIVFTIAVGGSATTSGAARVRWAAYVLAVLVQAGYEIGFIAASGQTPGKSALGIRVVGVETGEAPSPGQAFARWLLPALVGTIVPVLLSPGYLKGNGGLFTSTGAQIAGLASLGIYLYAFVDSRRQGIHDKIAGTVVVLAKR